jgi:ribosomal protein S14
MNTQRDSFLRLEVRKQNWLRLEIYKRLVCQKFLLKRICLRTLKREASLKFWQKVGVSISLVYLPKQSRSTKLSTRCRVTGRTHQAFRKSQLARMEFRRVMREGLLLGVGLGRT